MVSKYVHLYIYKHEINAEYMQLYILFNAIVAKLESYAYRGLTSAYNECER